MTFPVVLQQTLALVPHRVPSETAPPKKLNIEEKYNMYIFRQYGNIRHGSYTDLTPPLRFRVNWI